MDDYELVDVEQPPKSPNRYRPLPSANPHTKRNVLLPNPSNARPPLLERNSRSQQDPLPSVPQAQGVSLSHTTGEQHSKVVRSQTFTPLDSPPTAPRRRVRRTSEDTCQPPPVPSTPRPILHGRTSSNASPLLAKRPSSGVVQHSMSHDRDLHSAGTADQTLSLAVFVKRYSDSLPVRINVEKGFCGADDEKGISSGDQYKVHFLKRTKMVTIVDVNGHAYKIPLNSAVEFAPLYDPEGDFKKAIKGYTFDRASDIMALKSELPKVVRVLRSHHTGDTKSSVSESELLIVKGVTKTTFTRKSTLKVFSITNKENKVLSDDCAGKFSTNPVNIRLYVPEILDYISDPLPLKAAVCLSVDTSDELPIGLTTDAVTIETVGIQTSLIATAFSEEEEEEEEEEDENMAIEIPINLDVDVSIIEEEEEPDYADTMMLFKKFDPTKVRSCTGSREGFDQSVRQGHETLGTVIEKPKLAFQDEAVNPSPSQTSDELFYSSTLDQPPPLPPPNIPTRALPPKLPSTSSSPPLPRTPSQPQPPSTFTKKRVSPPTPRTAELPSLHESIGSTIVGPSTTLTNSTPSQNGAASICTKDSSSDLRAEVEVLRGQLSGLSKELYQLKLVVEEMQCHPPPISPLNSGGDFVERNISDLFRMSHVEILKLLEAMNMRQYQGVFMQEQIDGEVLCECDDTVLGNDLKVSSKLHRTRLLKVISGRHSVRNILEGQDPYVDLISNT